MLFTLEETGSDVGTTIKSGSEPARNRRRARHRWLAVGLSSALITFLAASALLFVFPATDQPRHVDGILSLNGTDETARESKAVSLAERGYAPVLLFSQGWTSVCPKVPRVRVVCFVAVPDRTVGEVRFAEDYARRHGWHSIMIIPGRAQATRARMLMKRCFSGRVVVVPASFQFWHFPSEVMYEWAALAKALVVDRHC